MTSLTPTVPPPLLHSSTMPSSEPIGRAIATVREMPPAARAAAVRGVPSAPFAEADPARRLERSLCMFAAGQNTVAAALAERLSERQDLAASLEVQVAQEKESVRELQTKLDRILALLRTLRDDHNAVLAEIATLSNPAPPPAPPSPEQPALVDEVSVGAEIETTPPQRERRHKVKKVVKRRKQ